MSERQFFVICPMEDGTHVYQVGEAELLKKLKERYWGNEEPLVGIPRQPGFDKARTPMPLTDTMAWGAPLIIEGRVVKPHQVEVVTEYGLPPPV